MRNYDTRHNTADPECRAYWRGDVWLRNKPWRSESGTAFLCGWKPKSSLGCLGPEMSSSVCHQAGYQHYFTSQARNLVQTSGENNSTATPQEEDPNPDFWNRQMEFHSYTPKGGTKSWLLG